MPRNICAPRGGGGRESKRTIRVHNELSQQLLSFESKYYDEWRKEAAGAKKKLYTPLILQHKKKILVNFETKIIRHIKERGTSSTWARRFRPAW